MTDALEIAGVGMADGARKVDRRALRIVLLSSLGGALEFYDFIIFGTFAAYISKAFFPVSDATISLLLTFVTFGVGYVARPLGGFIFGLTGDTRGRRGSFMVSLGVMSLATAAMGLIPTYAQGGILASVAFVGLRCVQGFCLGGELPGAITYAVEAVPARRATLACGVIFACVSSGVLVATAVFTSVTALLPPADAEAYGWRIGFVFGGALGIAGFVLRRSLEESPAFLRMRARVERLGGRGRSPLGELFARYPLRIVVCLLVTCVVAAFNGLLFAHMPAYLIRTLGYPGSVVAPALNIAAAATAVSLLVASWVADIIPRRHVYRVGCVVIALGAVPAYQAIAGKSLPLWELFLLIGLSAAFTHGTFAAIMADMFPTEVRFCGVATALNLGAVIFSGLGPILATSLIGATGRLDAPGFLVAGSALLALVSSFFIGGLEGEIAREEAHQPQPPR
jgi:MHS family proline/betaine transporter-like MFS transporter